MGCRDILRERLENKLSLRDADVRDGQTLMAEFDVVVKEDIEVNVAWTFVNDLFAAQ